MNEKTKTVKVEVEESCVVTLKQLAREYGKRYEVKAKPNPKEDCVDFTTDEGDAAYVDASGFAYRRDDGHTLPAYETEWAEDILDVPDVVWAHDENGVLVALTN